MLINAVIEKDENGYFAFVPKLKGCVSEGASFEEARANIKEAIELYLESLGERERYKALPQTKQANIYIATAYLTEY